MTLIQDLKLLDKGCGRTEDYEKFDNSISNKQRFLGSCDITVNNGAVQYVYLGIPADDELS